MHRAFCSFFLNTAHRMCILFYLENKWLEREKSELSDFEWICLHEVMWIRCTSACWRRRWMEASQGHHKLAKFVNIASKTFKINVWLMQGMGAIEDRESWTVFIERTYSNKRKITASILFSVMVAVRLLLGWHRYWLLLLCMKIKI